MSSWQEVTERGGGVKRTEGDGDGSRRRDLGKRCVVRKVV